MNNYLDWSSIGSFIKSFNACDHINYQKILKSNKNYKSNDVSFFDESFEKQFNIPGFSNEFFIKDDYILDLDDCILIGGIMYLITSDGLLRESVGGKFDYTRTGKSLGKKINTVINEPVLVVGNTGYQNYYHWTIQAISNILHFKDTNGFIPKIVLLDTSRNSELSKGDIASTFNSSANFLLSFFRMGTLPNKERWVAIKVLLGCVFAKVTDLLLYDNHILAAKSGSDQNFMSVESGVTSSRL